MISRPAAVSGGVGRPAAVAGGIGRIAAVTGGTGFLGRYVVAELVRAGWHVRMLARRDPTHPLLADHSVELVLGDLHDPAALSKLVRDATAVVHAGAVVKARHAHEFFSVNRDGSAHLAGIVAREAPGARFIAISSQAARQPTLSAYAESKRAGEVAAIAALGATPWVVVRPSAVYGPWDHEGMEFLRMAQHRLAPVPTAPEPQIAMIHARDAARAIVALCEPGPSGVIYEISDANPEGYSWREILRRTGVIFGQKPRFVPVPDLLFRARGIVNDRRAAITGRPIVFGLGKAREILHRDWGSDALLQPPASLWRAQTELTAGLRETIAWWQSYRGRPAH